MEDGNRSVIHSSNCKISSSFGRNSPYGVLDNGGGPRKPTELTMEIESLWYLLRASARLSVNNILNKQQPPPAEIKSQKEAVPKDIQAHNLLKALADLGERLEKRKQVPTSALDTRDINKRYAKVYATQSQWNPALEYQFKSSTQKLKPRMRKASADRPLAEYDSATAFGRVEGDGNSSKFGDWDVFHMDLSELD